MKAEYYTIFDMCFPDMKLSYQRFCQLLQKERCVYFEEHEGDVVCAFAILEDYAIRLLCVMPSLQGRGIGTKLLAQIEEYAGKKGYDQILTGGVSSNLFIGAPSLCWPFFEKRGFKAEGGCDEMLLKLQDFQLDDLNLHGSDQAEYDWFDGDLDEIRTAVSQVDEEWPQYFTNSEKIYVGKVNGEVASFCLVDLDCQNYLTDQYGKVGMPGCVGTVPKFRNQGIALEMVARATDYLKKQGMDVSFIYYTGVAKWYEKIGYKTFLSEHFGVKKLG